MTEVNTEDSSSEVILRDEVIRNQRIVDHPDLGQVRLQRPTPRIERQVAAERQKQYHSDLRNADILSKAELQVLYEKRGMWNEDKDARLQELSRRVGELMGLLNFLGYRSFDELADRYWDLRTLILDKFEDLEEDKDKVLAAINRYFRLVDDEGVTVTPVYSDRALIQGKAPSTEVDDMLDEAERLREQLDTLKIMGEARTELMKLQREYTTCFVDSLEARANRAEELAQLYYCAGVVMDEENKAKDERIADTFEEFLDSDPDLIGFIQEEMYFFINGVSKEMREVFARHGFTQRMLTSDEESESSPEHPTPSSDGEPQETPDSDSSE